MKETIGERLKRLRSELKMTQEQVADAISIAHNTYVRYENDLRKPIAKNANLLANFYHISVNELLTGTKENTITDSGKLNDQAINLLQHLASSEEQLIFNYRQLSDQNKINIQNYIQFLLNQQNNEKEA